MKNKEKFLYIIRGIPGCGKSTLAASFAPGTVVLEADQFFLRNGKYNWNRDLLGAAHKDCQRRCIEAMRKGTKRICVSNTNTKSSDMRIYRELAELYDYVVFYIIVENRHNGMDKHDVPDDVKVKMDLQLRQSMILRPGGESVI